MTVTTSWPQYQQFHLQESKNRSSALTKNIDLKHLEETGPPQETVSAKDWIKYIYICRKKASVCISSTALHFIQKNRNIHELQTSRGNGMKRWSRLKADEGFNSVCALYRLFSSYFTSRTLNQWFHPPESLWTLWKPTYKTTKNRAAALWTTGSIEGFINVRI